MSMTRVLPVGVPVAAGIAAAGGGVVLLLSLVGLLFMLLAARSIWLRVGTADETGGESQT